MLKLSLSLVSSKQRESLNIELKISLGFYPKMFYEEIDFSGLLGHTCLRDLKHHHQCTICGPLQPKEELYLLQGREPTKLPPHEAPHHDKE